MGEEDFPIWWEPNSEDKKHESPWEEESDEEWNSEEDPKDRTGVRKTMLARQRSWGKEVTIVRWEALVELRTIRVGRIMEI